MRHTPIDRGRTPCEESRAYAGIRAAERMAQPVVTVHPERSVRDAWRTMRARAVRRLPVVDAGGRLVGIVTERDLHRLMIFALPGTVASGSLLLRDAALFTDRYELTMAAGRGPGGVTAGGRRDEGREGGQP